MRAAEARAKAAAGAASAFVVIIAPCSSKDTPSRNRLSEVLIEGRAGAVANLVPIRKGNRRPAAEQGGEHFALRLRLGQLALDMARNDAEAVIERAVKGGGLEQKGGSFAVQLAQVFQDLNARGRVQHFEED